jgi:small GTP-binding protein
VVLRDTPGLDDEGELGLLRVKRGYQVLEKTDIALVVVDAREGITAMDETILQRIREKTIPHLVVFSKGDLLEEGIPAADAQGPDRITVSAKTGENIRELREKLAGLP